MHLLNDPLIIFPQRKEYFFNAKGIYEFLLQLDSGITGTAYYRRYKKELYVLEPSENFNKTIENYGPESVEKLWKLIQAIMVLRESTKGEVKHGQEFYPPTKMLLYSKTFLLVQLCNSSEKWSTYIKSSGIGLRTVEHFYEIISKDDLMRTMLLQDIILFFNAGIMELLKVLI